MSLEAILDDVYRKEDKNISFGTPMRKRSAFSKFCDDMHFKLYCAFNNKRNKRKKTFPEQSSGILREGTISVYSSCFDERDSYDLRLTLDLPNLTRMHYLVQNPDAKFNDVKVLVVEEDGENMKKHWANREETSMFYNALSERLQGDLTTLAEKVERGVLKLVPVVYDGQNESLEVYDGDSKVLSVKRRAGVNSSIQEISLNAGKKGTIRISGLEIYKIIRSRESKAEYRKLVNSVREQYKEQLKDDRLIKAASQYTTPSRIESLKNSLYLSLARINGL